MEKEFNEEMSAVDLRDYYHSLRKSDKGKLLRYMIEKFGMSYITLLGKFAGRLEMSKGEIVLFNLAVNDENLWKK